MPVKPIWSYAGLTLAVAVAALLVVPGFLDWSRYAGLIEEQAEVLTGRDVTIAGDVRIAMLPSPTLRLGKVTVANLENASASEMFRAAAMTAELSVGALFRGDLVISRLTLETPYLLLEKTGDGRRNWDFVADDTSSADGAALSVGAVSIRKGEIAFLGASSAAAERLTDIDADISVSGLRGPYRARGTALAGEMPLTFSAAVGTVAPDKAYPANLSVTFDTGTLEVRGILTGRGADLRFDGAASGTLASAVSPLLASVAGGQDVVLSGGIVAGSNGFDVRDLRAAAGPAVLTGRLEMRARSQIRLSADLALTRADLTGVAHANGRFDGEDIAAVASGLIAHIPDGAYSLSIDDVLLPSGRLSAVEIEAEAGGNTVALSQARARLPGGAEFQIEGAASSGEEGPYFSGDLTMTSLQGGELIDWLAGGTRPLLLSVQAVDTLSVESGIFLTPKRISLDRIDMSLGNGGLEDSSITGRLALTFGGRPTVTAELDVSRFALPPLGPPLGRYVIPGRAIDFGVDGALALRAEAIDAGGLHLEDVALRVEAEGTALTVRELLFRNTAGASGTLSGAAGNGAGQFQATLTAPDMASLEGTGALPMAASDTLAPVSASAQLSWPAQPPELTLPATGEAAALSILGRAGPIEIEINGHLAPGAAGIADAAYDMAARARAAAWPDLARLAIAMVLPGDSPVFVTEDAGSAAEGTAGAEGLISLVARGRLGGQTSVAARTSLGPLAAMVEGTTAQGQIGAEHVYEVSLDVGDTKDLEILGLPGLGLTAAKLAGAGMLAGQTLKIERSEFDLTNGEGRIAGSASGRLDLASDIPEFQATVSTSSLDLDLLHALFQRADHASRADEIEASDEPEPDGWSTRPLALDWLRAANGNLVLSGDGIGSGPWRVNNLAADIAISDDTLAISGLRGILFNGEMRASATLTGVRGAAIEIDLAGKRMDGAQLAAALPFGEIGTGTVDVELSLSGQGLSELALVSSLKGRGAVALRDGTLSGLDLSALSDGLSGLDDLDAFAPLAEETLHAGQTPIETLGGVFEITAGVMRAPAMAVQAPAASGTVAAFVDAGRRAVDVEASFDLADPAEAPDVKVLFAGQVGEASRTVNSLALEAFAAQRILERDIDALVEGGGSRELRDLLGLPAADAREAARP